MKRLSILAAAFAFAACATDGASGTPSCPADCTHEGHAGHGAPSIAPPAVNSAAAVAAAPASPATPARAIAKIEAKSGSTVAGTATFTDLGGGKVDVVVELSGLTPGKHGLHLHEKGDCSAADGASAGGHWNPHGKAHGGPAAAEKHAGDFGNLEAGADGKGRLQLTWSDFALTGEHGVIGHGIIVHDKADDLTTQPTGNAGARVGCGVVTGG